MDSEMKDIYDKLSEDYDDFLLRVKPSFRDFSLSMYLNNMDNLVPNEVLVEFINNTSTDSTVDEDYTSSFSKSLDRIIRVLSVKSCDLLLNCDEMELSINFKITKTVHKDGSKDYILSCIDSDGESYKYTIATSPEDEVLSRKDIVNRNSDSIRNSLESFIYHYKSIFLDVSVTSIY